MVTSLRSKPLMGNIHSECVVRYGNNASLRAKRHVFKEACPNSSATEWDLRCPVSDPQVMEQDLFKPYLRAETGTDRVVNIGSGDSGNECVAACIAFNIAVIKKVIIPTPIVTVSARR